MAEVKAGAWVKSFGISKISLHAGNAIFECTTSLQGVNMDSWSKFLEDLLLTCFKYVVIGLKALKRAAIKVADDARKNNYKIPIWRNGRIEHVIPEILTEQKH